jgi:alpha-glucosidase/oligosaccharide 4-alpha-D-glucosyltransferase
MPARLFLFLVTFTVVLSSLHAQQADRTVTGYQDFGTYLEVYASDGHFRIQFITSSIVETSFIPEGESYIPESHAVILKPVSVFTTLTDQGSSLLYGSPGLDVVIEFAPLKIKYSYKNRFLIEENPGYVKTDSSERIGFRLDNTEALYGGGARALGMNRRGNLLQLYNKAHYGYEYTSELMNYTMPLVLSSKKYMLHFDNAPIGYLDLDSKGNNTLIYETISGRKTYQVIAGDDWPALMNQYTLLTGRQPMPPRWTFGNFSSRFGYHSEGETRATVNRFLQDSIPLDVVVIDIYWFGADIKGHMGNLEFLTDSFPTPVQMMADFEALGVQTVLVTEPFILTTSKRWEEAVEHGILALDSTGAPHTYDFYFGNTGIIDLYKPEARDWFWNIYKDLTYMGVDGWWGDLGEPEVHPPTVLHHKGSADEVHNIYGHDWAGLIYEGYQKDFPDRRPFILMRAGYSGSQRYGMIPWSGDVLRSWGGLAPQPEIALQMGMQGLAYMHSDLGGFGEGEVFDPELYVRWLQYGVFQPVFRPHAQEHIPAEPVFHDPETKALAKKAIELRYRLLPYNYTLAFENSRTGMPLMRPLLFEEPDNVRMFGYEDAYLWGDHFLVVPITEPGLEKTEVYLPDGSQWYDFYTNEVFEGGQTLSVLLSPDKIPVFVRAGAFIPMVKPVASTQFYSLDEMEVHCYPDPSKHSSSYSLYHDDGKTPEAFAKGQFEMIKFTGQYAGADQKIAVASKPGDNYQQFSRKIRLIVHNQDKKPEKVSLDQQEIPFEWDENSNQLIVPLELNTGSELNVIIASQTE